MIIIHKWIYYVLVGTLLGVSIICGLMGWQLVLVNRQNRESRFDRLNLHLEQRENLETLKRLDERSAYLDDIVRKLQEADRKRKEAREAAAREKAARK